MLAGLALSEQRRQEHVLITGTADKGKGVNVLVPGILRENGCRSLFTIDLKHEQMRLTACAAAQRHTLWVVAPHDPAHSMGYNPLAFIDTFEVAVDFACCWGENAGGVLPLASVDDRSPVQRRDKGTRNGSLLPSFS